MLKHFLMDEAKDGDQGAGGGDKDEKVDRGDEVTLPKDDSHLDDADKKKAEDEIEKGRDKDKDEEPEDDSEEERDRKRIRIPKARFDEAVARERAVQDQLKREIEALRKQLPTDDPGKKELADLDAQLDELDKAFEKAVFDGKPEDAARARAERRKIERQVILKQAESLAAEKAGSAKGQALDEFKYDMLLERYEEEFPELNMDAEEFNEAKARQVARIRDGEIALGSSMAAALREAVSVVFGARKAAKGTETLNKMDEATRKREERAEAARRKAAEDAKKQPERTDKAGDDHDKHGGDILRGKSIFEMSQDEFAKLKDEDVAKLRGDAL